MTDARDARDARLAALYAEGSADAPPSAHPTPEALADAARRRGPEADRLRTLGHVATCQSCRRDFELLRSAHVAGRQLVAHGWRVRIAGLAAAAVVVAAITLSVNRTGPAERGVASSESERSIALIAPLLWHSVAGATEYRVDVLDSNGAVIKSVTTRDTTVWMLAPPRSYHWWVRTTVNGQPWKSTFGTFTTRP
jgi:hypothetical protein